MATVPIPRVAFTDPKGVLTEPGRYYLNQVIAAQTSIENIDAQVAAILSQFATLQASVSAISAVVAALETSLAAMASQIATLQSSIASVSSQVTQIQQDIEIGKNDMLLVHEIQPAAADPLMAVLWQ